MPRGSISILVLLEPLFDGAPRTPHINSREALVSFMGFEFDDVQGIGHYSSSPYSDPSSPPGIELGKRRRRFNPTLAYSSLVSPTGA